MAEGIYVTKREQFTFGILEQYRAGDLTRSEAASVLGVSPKTVQRQTRALREQGIKGLKHGNCGKSPANKMPQELREKVLALIKEKYFDFNIAHAREMLMEHHGLRVSYAVLHAWCRQASLGRSKRRRASKARIHRERMANEGLMLQMDGSHHKWNGKDKWCLIAMIDDATSDIPCAQMFASETTWACLTVLRQVIEKKGIPYTIYTDRAGWAGVKREYFSQFERACNELGITLITTSSPQAKGRIENAWKTFQSRLVPELRLHQVTSMAGINRYLNQSFLPAYWTARNTVAPRDKRSRYRAVPEYMNLDDIICMQYQRVVASDHTVSFAGERYRILEHRFRSLRGKQVTIRQDEQNKARIFLGHIELKVELINQPKRRWLKNSA